MSIRQAMYAAADYIAAHPERYNFMSSDQPTRRTCGTPGCMLGWTGIFLDVQHSADLCRTWIDEVAAVAGTTVIEFCDRLDLMQRQQPEIRFARASDAAVALRQYADKYHPAESRSLIPASVRAIFTMTPDQIRAEFQRDVA